VVLETTGTTVELFNHFDCAVHYSLQVSHACEGLAVRRKAFSRQKEHSASAAEKPKISRSHGYKKLSDMSDGISLRLSPT
jgi:hypothetical protein